MTVHFAAARTPSRSPVARILACGPAPLAANDNAFGQDNQAGNDLMLHAALRHFAQHGLSAAKRARAQAESAFFAGDRDSYDWWHGICRALDKRVAAQLDASVPRETRA